MRGILPLGRARHVTRPAGPPRWSWHLAALSLLLSILLPATGAGAPVADAHEFMPTSQIRPGMTAVAKTVFHGTAIEDFHLEILGVLPKARGGGDVILARVTDGVLVERQSGILQGMSGSPVYIGGRLIGAIAFAWGFSKEPIAGITPIADMLRALASEAQHPADEPRAPETQVAAPPVIGGRAMERVRILDSPAPPAGDTVEPAGTLTLRPLGALLFASGMSPRAMERLGETLRPFGATVMQGVGGSADFPGGDLRPGAAVGVQLVRGDFDVTGIGTVTYVEGDRVLAFGHPLLAMGDVDFTLTTAYINTIVPSYLAGMKMGYAGRPVGRLAQDGIWAVAGITGQPAQTIAVAVTVSDPGRGLEQTFNAEIAPHRLLAPGLAATVVMSAIDRAWEHISEGTAQVRVEIEGEKRTIRRTDTAFSSGDAAVVPLMDILSAMSTFMDNEFGAVRVKAVRVAVRLTDQRRTARVEDLSAQPGKIKAGDTLDLRVRLRPFKGDPVDQHLQLRLPPDLPDGSLRVGVAGGNEIDQLRPMLGLARRRAFNLEQLIDIYQTAERGDELVALVALPTAGVAVEGERVPALPNHVAELLLNARSGTVSPQGDYLQASLPCAWVLEGRQVISVEIEGKPGAAKRGGPRSRPGPPEKQPPPEEQPEPEEDQREELASSAVSVSPPAASSPATGAPDRAVAANAAEERADEETANGKPEKEETKQAQPVGRAPSLWTHSKRADFLDGEFDGIACDDDGVLTLAPEPRVVAQFDEPVLTAVLAHDGAVYVASAPGGRVRKLSGDGVVMQTWDTGAAIITSLAADPQGAILAGAAPGGRVLALGDDGRVREHFATGEATVWSLVSAPDGAVYAGTGPHGKVFVITATGEGGPGAGPGRLLTQLPATNVYALAVAGDLLYAGTGNAGVLYAVDAGGRTRVAYDSDQEAIVSLATDADGTLYAGSARSAAIIRLRPGQGAQSVITAEGEVLAAIAPGPQGTLYAVTAEDAIVYQVDPERKTARVLRKPKQGQAIALTVDDQGAVLAAESNPAALVRIGPGYAAHGALISKPQSAPPGTRWGALSCAVELPAETTASFQTRSGNSADPDDHWSPWSALAALDGVADILSPPARFLQYRVVLDAPQPSVTPRVRDVEVNYLPPNSEPTVTFSAPKPAERVRETVDIKWKGKDPDRDQLIYDISVSANGAAAWTELKRDLEGDSYSWDTTKSTDGAYELRVTASDRRSNPGAALEGDARRVVWVDNTPPSVLLLRHTLAVGAKGVVSLRGAAWDELSPLQGVDYRVDDGEWSAAMIEGVAGKRRVSFKVETAELAAGDHDLKVRAFDQAGNNVEAEMRVKVKEAACEPGGSAESPGN